MQKSLSELRIINHLGRIVRGGKTAVNGALYLYRKIILAVSYYSFMEIIKAFITYLATYVITYYGIKYSLSDHFLVSTLNIGISALAAASITALLSTDLFKRNKNKA
ncbi:hypothetical protein DFQ12_1835 [Sphingobacterium detergens]|uniref:Uncharacterized protein n=2 Tax=Sphingobacterium detergens TaxID=1145106 RepID=A0A420BJK7_SPHD1|nr:hypothetical protein DFQ12_1835 [Sphingobacterium detergens]